MILIIDNQSSFIKEYEKELLKQKIDFTVIPYFKETNFPCMRKDIKGVILSGGPGIPEGPLKLKADYSALKNLDVPIIGFCLGAEAIAYLFKGKIKPLHEKQDKIQTIQIKKQKDPIFKNLPKTIKLKEKHTHYISKLPKDFEIIASSDICPIEAMKHKQKPIYAFQSHPESSGKHGKIIMKNFFEICNRE